MAEIRAAEDKYVTMVPRFELPKDFDKPKPDIAQPAAPPTEAKPPATEAVATPPEAEVKVDETTEEPDKETTGKDPEKQSNRRFERRIDRATKRAAEAQARAEALEKELAEFKQKSAPQTPSAEPKMEDYTDIKEYAKAFAEYEKANAIKDYEKKQVEQRNQQAQQQLISQWNDKVAKAEDKYDDFREVVGDLKPTTPWAVALMEEDNGEEVAYYLGNHIKEAQKIFSLHPLAQAREIGKLSVKLATQKEAPQKPSKAPAPITPVSGNTSISEPDFSKPMDPADYMKHGAKMFRGR